MDLTPTFPTKIHQEVADIARNYFTALSTTDTILVTNSCARSQASPESDLDLAILAKPDSSPSQIHAIESDWQEYAKTHPKIIEYKESSIFAHLHVDIITGNYETTPIEFGGQVDSFELELGNHLAHSAPFGQKGEYFNLLKSKWLPYYNDNLRAERLKQIAEACAYDLSHLNSIKDRGLHFHAFDILYSAFQKFLQIQFIASRIYPIAYNKWIKLQIVEWLRMPELYAKLLPIISITDIASDEIKIKAQVLNQLLKNVKLN